MCCNSVSSRRSVRDRRGRGTKNADHGTIGPVRDAYVGLISDRSYGTDDIEEFRRATSLVDSSRWTLPLRTLQFEADLTAAR